MQQTNLFNGYTKQEENAIYQTVKPLLKDDADWDRFLFDISTTMVDLCEGNSHQDSLLYMSKVEERYSKLIQAYEKLGERLQWDLDDVLGCRLPDVVKGRISALSGHTTDDQSRTEWEDWAALVEQETGEHIDLPAVSSPQTEPLRHFNVQKDGRWKNHTIRLAGKRLMEIFKMSTEMKPVVSWKYTSDDPYEGKFYRFGLACLAPVFPDSAAQLGSPLRTIYREANPSRTQ